MPLLITCEHAGNEVPVGYSDIIQAEDPILQTHRGYDPGAWEMSEYLANILGAPLFGCHTTRLLVETNRSAESHQLFSEYSVGLNGDRKQLLLHEIYNPYRNAVITAIKQLSKPVVHLSIHTFTPVLNGSVRDLEVGILFDPDREPEQQYCQALADFLNKDLSPLRITFNEPYKGTDDGFTTYLRTQFQDKDYLGIEIEINQKMIGTSDWFHVQKSLAMALQDQGLES